MRLPTGAVLAALGGSVVARDRMPGTIAIATDTRTIRPSETFLALRGERFDGHAFLAEAVARGASAAIVDDTSALPEGVPGIVVPQTLTAYLQIARLARERLRGPVIAITGSAGKTTTKALLAQTLAAAGRPAAATPENENNEIGVAKFLTNCDDGDERVAVIEMGCRHYRDIDPLVEAAQPDVAILTNIGEAHLEIMGSRERLADTKWGIFATGARAVLNLADADSRERAVTLGHEPAWYGIDDERPPQGQSATVVRGTDVVLIDRDGERSFAWTPGLPGDHNRRNMAGALAAARLIGVDLAVLARQQPALTLPAGRYERISLPGGVEAIYDAYNASMSGALATLATFARERASRRIAVFGSMAELGDDAESMHERVGAAAAVAADVVLAGGAFAEAIARGARAAGATRIVVYASNDDALAWLRENLASGDVVLFKGSRRYRMEQIVAGLRA